MGVASWPTNKALNVRVLSEGHQNLYGPATRNVVLYDSYLSGLDRIQYIRWIYEIIEKESTPLDYREREKKSVNPKIKVTGIVSTRGQV